MVFGREILGIEFNRAQVRLLRYVQPDAPGWEWRFKRFILTSGNQVGKTVLLAVIILWACTYKIGKDFTDPAWATHPYMWGHLAPTQAQAYHPLREIRLLIKGSHPMQQKSGMPFRFPEGLVSEIKVDTQFDGLSFQSGAIAQFRTTADKAAAVLGYKFDAVSVDEAAFEDHLVGTINETLMMRLIASEGPMFLVSTPNGLNDFYEIVKQVQDHMDSPEEMVWLDQDNRWVLVWATIADNIGFGISAEYAEAMELALDPATKEQQLRGAFLEPAEAFFVPQDRIISAFGVGDTALAKQARILPAEDKPKPGHRYVIFWDPSVSGAGDPTACVVIDITRKPWIGVQFRHYPKPLDTYGLLNEMLMLHNFWNSGEDPTRLLERSTATTGWDATALGGRMWSDLLRSVRPGRPLNLGGGDQKVKYLIDTRNVLSKGELLIPASWQQLRNEVMSYRLKDDKIVQDSVMALMGAVVTALRGTNTGPRPFDVHARVGYRR